MPTIRQNHNFIACLLTLALISACAVDDKASLPAEAYFKKAMTALDEDDSFTAAEMLQQLNNQHPFSPYARQALLELAHIELLAENYSKANASVNRFLRLHRQSEQSDYAYYLRAMIAFEQDRTILQNRTSIDPSLRDLNSSKKAYKDFAFILRNYPTSHFAEDARSHMVYIRSLLARHEVAIGEFYLSREAWVAAANRGSYVLENYSDSHDSVARSLDILIAAYTQMEMTQQAEKAERLLASNFPNYILKHTIR